ncbi:rust resistance kinase Lr10-like [Cryptomeria japonica]|uniref:rust resistance kinase Lr10-like n=1 Tax=Cryptomeria japonica TaxID=3369 RepID=UPI0025AD0A6C|nr:rust resistance kinase Lr10-like [Cryptomeria japonica]
MHYYASIPGIAIGASAFIMIVALFLIVVYRKGSSYFKGNETSVAMEPMNSGSIGKVENFLQSYIHQMPTRYSFSQLKKITNNFSDKLGEGGFGVVYKGKLRSGFLVAVKLLDQSRQSEGQFINEVATLGTIHHFHLVRLMGFCFEGFRSALVYEYMANGSLEKFIFQGKEAEQMLSWDQLYSIALGAARGIAYLHQDCSRRIIHFDIKPHNILLDADFTPKVADFGLAKLYKKEEDHVSITATRGTPGYVAPELWSRDLGPVTDKSDVYSFGMVLLEIAGRRKNIDVQVSRSSQLYFPEWEFKLIESGELVKRLRERGRGDMEAEDEEKLRRLAKVGLWCIQYNSNDRPSMSRVVQMLEGNGDDVSNPPLPFNSSPPREAPLSSSSEESSSML